MDFIIIFDTLLIYGKGLLENHSIHIAGIGIASETEISKAVYNISAFICFISLKHMRVVAAYDKERRDSMARRPRVV